MKSSLKNSLIITAIACGLGMSHLAQAERVYKWVDAQGNVHFGDRQSATNNSEEIQINVPKGTPAPAKKGEAKDSKASDEPKSELSPEAKAEMAKYCEQMKANLHTLETRSRVRVTEGESTRFLSPEEIESKKAEILESIEKNCS